MPAQFAPRGLASLQAAQNLGEMFARAGATRAQLEQADREMQARERMQQQGIMAQQQSQREAQAFEMESMKERAKLHLDQDFMGKYGAPLEELQREADEQLDPNVYQKPGQRLRTYLQGLDAKRNEDDFKQKLKLGQEALDTQQQRDLQGIDKAINEVKSGPQWNPAFEGDTRREEMLGQLDQRRLGIIMGAYENAASGRSRRGSGAALQQENEWVQEEHPQLGWVQKNQATGEIKGITAGAGSKLGKTGAGAGGSGASKSAGGVPQFNNPQERVGYYLGAASSHIDESMKTTGGFEIEEEVPGVDDSGAPTGKMDKEIRKVGPSDPRYKDLKKQAIIAEATARMEAEDALIEIEAKRAFESKRQQEVQAARERHLGRIKTFQNWASLDMPGVMVPPELGGSRGPTQAHADELMATGDKMPVIEKQPPPPAPPPTKTAAETREEAEANKPRWRRAIENAIMSIAPSSSAQLMGNVGQSMNPAMKTADQVATHLSSTPRSEAADQRALRQRWGDQGGTNAKALPSDRSKLVKGEVYVLANGKLGRWVGEGFESVEE